MNFKEYAEKIGSVPISEVELSAVPIGFQPHISLLPMGVIALKDNSASVIKIPSRVVNKYGMMVSVITAKDTVFAGNESITNIILPHSFCSIPSGAFAGCGNLRNITIPIGISRIKEGTFAGCTALENIYYEGSMEEWAKINIVHQRHEIEFGRQVSGAPIDEIVSESLIHIAGNDALFSANIHFNCMLEKLYDRQPIYYA